jgi:serine phosphatase RsbU (regulator of sigma subunit)
MNFFKILITVIGVLCLGQAQAANWDALPAYEVNLDTPIVSSLKSHTWVLEDPDGSLTVDEVLQREHAFRPVSEMATFDARHHYWILQKISSRLPADKSYRLEGNWQRIYTHVIRSDGSITHLKASGFYSGKYTFLSDIDPVLPSSAAVPSREALFTLHRDESLTLLSRTKAVSSFPPRSFGLQLIDNERFLETRRFGLYLEGALLGVLFALLIFGWYSHFVNKDRAGLFYGIWISFALLQILSLPSQDGAHLAEFFINTNDKYFGASSLAGLFSYIGAYGQIFFYFTFASAYLQISKHHPKTQKLIYALIGYFVLHLVVNTLYDHNISPQVFFSGNAFLPILVFVFLYAAAIERYRQGMSVAIYWLVASIPYFIFRLIWVAGLMGYPSVFSYLPESGLSYFLQNTNISQSIALCAEALIMALAVVSRNVWIQKELAKSIDAQKSMIEGQNKILEETVAERTKELAEQHQELDEAHQLVVGSVNYASRLQRGQLPRQIRIDGRFASFATLWEPRDTIGGDLYWLSSSQYAGPFVLAVADCTGHGVPGAMLSLLVSNSLERIYANDTSEDPDTALMSLDHYVRTGLNQDRPDSESDDGCDAAVLRIDRDKHTIEFAAAKLGLFQVSSSGEITRHQGSRCSLGYQDAIQAKDKPALQIIHYQAGDTFAVVTDGVTDQIGGNGRVKTSFGYRRIEQILKSHCNSDANYMAYVLKKEFTDWQGNETRRDDLTAVLFKL